MNTNSSKLEEAKKYVERLGYFVPTKSDSTDIRATMLDFIKRDMPECLPHYEFLMKARYYEAERAQ